MVVFNNVKINSVADLFVNSVQVFVFHTAVFRLDCAGDNVVR